MFCPCFVFLKRLAVTFAAERFIFGLLAEHHALLVVHETVADVGQRAASYADGMHLSHFVGNGAQGGYGAEGHALEVHVESGHDDAYALVGKFVAYGHESVVENCASSMPTTSMSDDSSNIDDDESTGVLIMELRSWLTTSISEYRVSRAGLKISTLCFANSARLSLLISSSVLPENIDPHTTSILPGRCASPARLLFIMAQNYKDVLKIAKKYSVFCTHGLFNLYLWRIMGLLYIVPTPVGNMEDMTLRAIRILKEADLVLAEDTRTSGILLKHFEIKNQLYAHHKFNEHGTSASIVERLKAGAKVALISDAGTPGISDPGFFLVREAVSAGVTVQCLPGATAFVPALVSSGLPCDRFCFEGFLPQKKGRATRLDSLREETRTMIFYESPYRVLKTLEQFAEYFGEDRRASACREISKIHEESVRGTLAELIAHFKETEPRGEFVIVVAGKNVKERKPNN